MGKVTAGTKIPCRVCRTLDVGDFSMLHQLTWFNMAIHTNAEYAKGTWFKERSLAGPVIFTFIILCFIFSITIIANLFHLCLQIINKLLALPP